MTIVKTSRSMRSRLSTRSVRSPLAATVYATWSMSEPSRLYVAYPSEQTQKNIFIGLSVPSIPGTVKTPTPRDRIHRRYSRTQPISPILILSIHGREVAGLAGWPYHGYWYEKNLSSRTCDRPGSVRAGPGIEPERATATPFLWLAGSVHSAAECGEEARIGKGRPRAAARRRKARSHGSVGAECDQFERQYEGERHPDPVLAAGRSAVQIAPGESGKGRSRSALPASRSAAAHDHAVSVPVRADAQLYRHPVR